MLIYVNDCVCVSVLACGCGN